MSEGLSDSIKKLAVKTSDSDPLPLKLQHCGLASCPNPASLRCSRCRVTFYCSRPCSEGNWGSHKKECRRLEREARSGFRVQDMPGKGRGLVASRALQPGHVLLTEKPLLVASDKDSQLDVLHEIDKLSPEERMLVLGLHDPGSDGWDSSEVTDEEQRKILRIFVANRIGCSSASEDSGLYANISLINHSCSPNVCWSWLREDPGKTVKQVRVVRRIKEGEEICAAYIDLEFLVREERREELAFWFPSCSCPLCQLHGEQLERNEATRRLLTKLHRRVENLGTQGCSTGEEAVLELAAQAALEKVEVMERICDEVAVKVPVALMDYCTLAAVLGRRGERERKMQERARTMAVMFGDAARQNYEARCQEIGME